MTRRPRLLPALALLLLAGLLAQCQDLVNRSVIRGTVKDVNGNPVQNVRLHLNSVNGDTYKGATPAVDGTFTVTGLPAGLYNIGVDAKWPLRQQQVPVAMRQVHSASEPVDFVLPLGVIVHGSVVDKKSGKPVEVVRLEHAVGYPAYGRPQLSTQLELDNGRFSLYSPAGDFVKVTFTAEGYLEETILDLVEPATGSVIGPLTIQLVEGEQIAGRVEGPERIREEFQGHLVTREEREQRFARHEIFRDGAFEFVGLPAGEVYQLALQSRFYDMSAIIEEVTSGSTDLVVRFPEIQEIAGTVVDASTNEPLNEFTIVGYAAENADSRRYHQEAFAERSADGSFAIPIPVAVRAYISADAPGYARQWSEEFSVTPKGIRPQGLLPLHFALRPGHLLKARVMGGDSGFPLEGMEVRLQMRDPKPEGTTVYALHAETNSLGIIQLAGIESGTYEMTIKPKHNSPLERYIDWKREEVMIGDSTNLGTISIPRAGALEGVVRWESGEPVPRASVVVTFPDKDVHLYDSSDGDGSYSVARVPSGTAGVRLTLYTVVDNVGRSTYVQNATAAITAGRKTILDFTVPNGWILSGTVTRQGVPIETGQILFARDEDFIENPVPHDQIGAGIENGRYNVQLFEPGEYVVSISHGVEGYGRVATVNTGELEQTDTLNIEVQSIRVAGTIVDATGNPIRQAFGYARPAGLPREASPLWSRTVRWAVWEKGQFEVFVPEPGDYTIEVHDFWGRMEKKTLHVPKEGLEDLTLMQEVISEKARNREYIPREHYLR